MIHLIQADLRSLPESNYFPFSLPLLRGLKGMDFDPPVTLFVGENGTGKSTLLEALACAADMTVVGSESTRTDQSLIHARDLAKYIKLSWKKRTHRGFFLRAEDFFGYTRRLNQMRAEMESDLREIDQEYQPRSDYARGLAKMSYGRELGDMQQRYGAGLDVHSHGEGFMTLFQSRFVPDGLYLLDEPEAPLSPIRQLALIASIQEMATRNGQFIMATHSPILMAFPGAKILNFTGIEIHPTHYDDLEHVKLMRGFLQNPDAFLRRL